MAWTDRRILDLFGIELPIIQAPMANFSTTEMAIGAALAGGLGSLPCASLNAEQIRSATATIRAAAPRPVNLNFFCHTPVELTAEAEARWKQRLAGYYREHGLDPDALIPFANRAPFDEAMCRMVEELKPEGSVSTSACPIRRCSSASRRQAAS